MPCVLCGERHGSSRTEARPMVARTGRKAVFAHNSYRPVGRCERKQAPPLHGTRSRGRDWRRIFRAMRKQCFHGAGDGFLGDKRRLPARQKTIKSERRLLFLTRTDTDGSLTLGLSGCERAVSTVANSLLTRTKEIIVLLIIFNTSHNRKTKKKMTFSKYYV